MFGSITNQNIITIIVGAMIGGMDPREIKQRKRRKLEAMKKKLRDRVEARELLYTKIVKRIQLGDFFSSSQRLTVMKIHTGYLTTLNVNIFRLK